LSALSPSSGQNAGGAKTEVAPWPSANPGRLCVRASGALAGDPTRQSSFCPLTDCTRCVVGPARVAFFLTRITRDARTIDAAKIFAGRIFLLLRELRNRRRYFAVGTYPLLCLLLAGHESRQRPRATSRLPTRNHPATIRTEPRIPSGPRHG
jgi:hypothetical protein